MRQGTTAAGDRGTRGSTSGLLAHVRAVDIGAALRSFRERRSGTYPTLVILMMLTVSACTVEPQTIQLGSEACSHCRMVIGDQRFTAQALNRQGLAFSFDAIECMADWVATGESVAADDLHSLWVADFAAPHEWVRVEDAVFLRSDEVRSPMGAGLTAHGSADAARGYQAELGGELLGWDEVMEVVGRQGHHHDHAHAH
jgi:copper chaperone NosL